MVRRRPAPLPSIVRRLRIHVRHRIRAAGLQIRTRPRVYSLFLSALLTLLFQLLFHLANPSQRTLSISLISTVPQSASVPNISQIFITQASASYNPSVAINRLARRVRSSHVLIAVITPIPDVSCLYPLSSIALISPYFVLVPLKTLRLFPFDSRFRYGFADLRARLLQNDIDIGSFPPCFTESLPDMHLFQHPHLQEPTFNYIYDDILTTIIRNQTSTILTSSTSPSIPPSLHDHLSTLSHRRLLHDYYHLPHVLLASLSSNTHSLPAVSHLVSSYEGVLVAQVVHGLGNRLRAYASAAEYARVTNRLLVLVWPLDPHCFARFSDLFEPISHLVISSTSVDTSSWALDWASYQWEIYDYMVQKDAEILGNRLNLFYHGAYVLNTRRVTWRGTNVMLRSLVPTSPIREHLARTSGRTTSCTGVHVRSLPLTRDISSVNATSEYGKLSEHVINYWRSAAKVSSFKRRIESLPLQNRANVFIAADNGPDRKELLEMPGAWAMAYEQGEECDGKRERVCVQRALVDLLVLVRCRLVLGSFWSSFTEVVNRMGDGKMEMVGVDFGAVEVEGEVGEFVRKVLLKRNRRKKRG